MCLIKNPCNPTDGALAVTGSNYRKIRVWDVLTQEELTVVQASVAAVTQRCSRGQTMALEMFGSWWIVPTCSLQLLSVPFSYAF